MTESLGAVLKQYAEKLTNNKLVLPDDCLCPECNLLDVRKPGVQEYLEQRPDVPESGPWLCMCKDNQERLLKELLFGSNLPSHTPKSFVNFQNVLGTEKAVDAAKVFCADAGPRMLVLVGDAGCGKSHLLEAIGRDFITQSKSVRYEQEAGLLLELQGSYSPRAKISAWEILERCDLAHVLLLDDVGLAKSSDWTIQHVTTLVDGRYRNARRMVVATNKPHSEMVKNEDNFRLASRLFDANSGAVSVVYMTAPDYRTGS